MLLLHGPYAPRISLYNLLLTLTQYPIYNPTKTRNVYSDEMTFVVITVINSLERARLSRATRNIFTTEESLGKNKTPMFSPPAHSHCTQNSKTPLKNKTKKTKRKKRVVK